MIDTVFRREKKGQMWLLFLLNWVKVIFFLYFVLIYKLDTFFPLEEPEHAFMYKQPFPSFQVCKADLIIVSIWKANLPDIFSTPKKKLDHPAAHHILYAIYQTTTL